MQTRLQNSIKEWISGNFSRMSETQFNKLLISINAFVPLILFALDLRLGNVGTNPINFFLLTTGILTLVSLLITLSITPLRKLFGWNGLIKYRRMLGLYSFFYGTLHFATYSLFEKGGNLIEIFRDAFRRPFILVGFMAFLLMIPLAVTSTNGMIKRLGGKRWAGLHRMTYAIAVLGILHFYLLVKSDIFYPAMFGLILSVLLGYRILESIKKMGSAAVAKPPDGSH